MIRNVKPAGVVGLLLATIVGANLAVAYLPPVSVAPGIVAPAGVLFAGLALVLRDAVYELGGRRWVVGAIVAGTALSATAAAVFAHLAHVPADRWPRQIIASAVAFAASETLDSVLYRPLRLRGYILAAVGVAGVAGLIVDTFIYLPVAFGSIAYAPGQLIGKTWVILATLGVVATGRAAWKRAQA